MSRILLPICVPPISSNIPSEYHPPSKFISIWYRHIAIVIANKTSPVTHASYHHQQHQHHIAIIMTNTQTNTPSLHQSPLHHALVSSHLTPFHPFHSNFPGSNPSKATGCKNNGGEEGAVRAGLSDSASSSRRWRAVGTGARLGGEEEAV